MSDATKLPQAFLDAMKEILKDEYDEFLESFKDTRVYGLRQNLLKTAGGDFEKAVPFSLVPVPWAREGFYYDGEDRPGRHPLHEAGAYYIQEPSAMSAVEILDPAPGEVILDLCAAPGGKSTQIACRMNGEGLLVSNEIISDRATVLSSNIERLGIRNAVVTNESPEKLAGRFYEFFDKILVDAPCSGEGMFRKDENAVKEWSLESVPMCAARQAGILDAASGMLKTGGVLVYSTCTFSVEENEQTIEAFLARHPEYECERKERLWPHRIKGEGHFVARLKKKGNLIPACERVSAVRDETKSKKNKKSASSGMPVKSEITDVLVKEFKLTVEASEKLFDKKIIVSFGENIYLMPEEMGSIEGLTVLRPGLQIMRNLGNRFEPSHSLALSLRTFEVTGRVDLDYGEAALYISGEVIRKPGQAGLDETELQGWVPVFVEGFSLGFGKADRGTIKNHYPKGLRKNLING